MTPKSSLLLLTGPVGAGKTTLAIEIGELLTEREVPHAVIELDWLAWCNTPTDSPEVRRSLVLENLRAMVGSYKAAGIQRFVLAGSIVSEVHAAAIGSAFDGAEMEIVHVAVPPSVLVSRVQERDPGRKTIGSLDQAASFTATTRAAVPGCIEIDNSSAEITATAHQVLDQTGWRRQIEVDD